jgi:hypothetical protein
MIILVFVVGLNFNPGKRLIMAGREDFRPQIARRLYA